MANISTGTSITASGFNDLLTRLDNVRKNHLNKDGQNSNANSQLTTAFVTSVANQNASIDNANIQKIKDSLTTLETSEWLKDQGNAAKITVPSKGTLIKASDFNIWEDTVTTVEAVCPNYTQYSQYNKYSKYSAYGVYGAYSVYSHYDYTAYSNYYQYSNYSQNN